MRGDSCGFRFLNSPAPGREWRGAAGLYNQPSAPHPSIGRDGESIHRRASARSGFVPSACTHTHPHPCAHRDSCAKQPCVQSSRSCLLRPPACTHCMAPKTENLTIPRHPAQLESWPTQQDEAVHSAFTAAGVHSYPLLVSTLRCVQYSTYRHIDSAHAVRPAPSGLCMSIFGRIPGALFAKDRTPRTAACHLLSI